MSKTEFKTRKEDHEIDSQFLQRWSPRSFVKDHYLSVDDLKRMVAAARWSPSCFNEQPWHFYFGMKPNQSFNDFLSVLVEKNQMWAQNTSAIGLVTASKSFKKNGKPNSWAEFDTGAAWMSLALQALKMDLHCHAMAGFEADKAYELLGLSKDEHAIICAIAIGKAGSPNDLPEGFGVFEAPNERAPIEESITIK